MKGRCIEWGGCRNKEGYGRAYLNGREQPAHRWALEKFYGPIPAGLLALHRCDNPPCIHPRHLFVGTQKDNMQDAVSKGRKNRPKAACPAGHPLVGQNLMTTSEGRRRCRECRRAQTVIAHRVWLGWSRARATSEPVPPVNVERGL